MQKPGKSQFMWEKIDAGTKMTQILELSDTDFEIAIRKALEEIMVNTF